MLAIISSPATQHNSLAFVTSSSDARSASGSFSKRLDTALKQILCLVDLTQFKRLSVSIDGRGAWRTHANELIENQLPLLLNKPKSYFSFTMRMVLFIGYRITNVLSKESDLLVI